MRFSRGVLIIVPAVILCSLSTGGAESMIPDADFDIGVAEWPDTSCTEVEWDPVSDCTNNPASGSARVTNTAPEHCYSGTIHCVEWVPEGEPLDFSAWVKIPPGNTATGGAFLFLWWRTNENCQGSQITGPSSAYFSNAMPWTLISIPTTMPPAGTKSVQVYLRVEKTTQGEYSAYFDRVDFEVPNSIFVDSFEHGDTQRWSASQGD